MSWRRRWSPQQEAELFESFWREVKPRGKYAHVKCPVDGSDITVWMWLTDGPDRYRLWAVCPYVDCHRILGMPGSMDPLLVKRHDRRWTASQRADLVRRILEGERAPRCPVDGAAVYRGRYQGEDTRFILWVCCYRCGNEFEEGGLW
jgi:hypothetical protein